jgi:hypothetical protein
MTIDTRIALKIIVALLLIAAALTYTYDIGEQHMCNRHVEIRVFTKSIGLPRETVCVFLIATALVLIVFLSAGYSITDSINMKPTSIWLRNTDRKSVV